MSKNQGDAGLVARYASAFFKVASKQNALTLAEKDIQLVRDIFEESDDIKRLAHSPVFSRKEQAIAIGAVLDKAGISDVTKGFIAVLAQNRRLMLLSAIAEAFFLLLAQERGEITVEVISANALQKNQLTDISAALETSLNHNIRLQTLVDPKILGGLIVKIGSQMIDDSIKSKLERLQAISKNAMATL